MTNQLKHPPHLLIASLVKQNFKPGIRLGLIQLRYLSGGRARAVVERNSSSQSLNRGVGRHTLNFNLVNLLHAIAGRRHVIRKVAIVGEQQQAFGVEVETADGIQASQRRWQQLGDEWTAFGIGNTREITFGLVQQDVNFVAGLELRIDELAVYFDVIAIGISLAAQLFDHLSVYSDAAGNDQFFSVPA